MNDNGETRELMPRDELPRPMSLNELQELGKIMAASNLFPDVRSAAQCVVKILAGAEMGFGPFASMSDVHIIEGKPVVGAHLRAAAIKRSPHYDFDIVELSREVCELAFWERSLATGGETRKGSPGWTKKAGHVRMTLKEAVDSGLAIAKTGQLKVNWARTPDDMLFARCISKGYRRYCPDLSSGVLAYDPDEMDCRGDPLEVKANQPDPVPVASLPATPLPDLPAPAAALTPAAAAPAPPPPINTIQMAQIDALADQLAISQQAFRARVKQLYGTEDAARITGPQADDLIQKLSDAVKAKEAKAGQPAGSGQ